MIRVALPQHLRTLAGVSDEVQLELAGAKTPRALLDALEARHPVLRGTIREHGSLRRRPYVRFFVCREDWSHVPLDQALPPAVVSGAEPFVVLGAMSGG